MILFPGGSISTLPLKQMEFFGVSSCQEDNKSGFEKKLPLFSPQKVHFPQTSPVAGKIEGFFPKVAPHLWQRLAYVICFASTLAKLKKWFSLMKAHSSKTKRHTQHRKRHLGKTPTIYLWKVSPQGSRLACCMQKCTSFCWGVSYHRNFFTTFPPQILAPWSPSFPPAGRLKSDPRCPGFCKALMAVLVIFKVGLRTMKSWGSFSGLEIGGSYCDGLDGICTVQLKNGFVWVPRLVLWFSNLKPESGVVW